MFGSFDSTRLKCSYIHDIPKLRLFSLVLVCRGWRKMRYSLTFYFLDFILCLSCIVRHGISRFEGINENHEIWCSTNTNEFIGYVRKRTWANLPLPSKYSSSSNATKTESSTVGVHKDRNFTTKEMISIFPIWTFQLFVATFQQHLHMIRYFRECCSECCCKQGNYFTKGLVIKLGSSLRTMTCVTDTEYLHPKWPRICSSCRYHNPVVYKFMT
jgi:hypothetical protein